MLIDFKEYIGNQFKGKILHLTCDCIIKLDITGRCIDFEKTSSEIILIIDINGKRVPVGSNTNKLKIEVL